MKILAARLRQRRRQLRLNQKDVAKIGSSSLLSKVETGTSQPSLKTLQEWAQALKTTTGDLIGDQLLLEAAKHTILDTEKCHSYLSFLPKTETTNFLKELSLSATSFTTQVPEPPPDAELQYLAAKVHLHKGTPKKAAVLAQKALSQDISPLWRICHLTLLCQVYEQLSEPAKRRKAKQELQTVLRRKKTNVDLPSAAELTQTDLDQLKLHSLLQVIQGCLEA